MQKSKEKNKPVSTPKKISTKRIWLNLLIKISVIALAVWTLFPFVLGITINYGNQMHPAVNDGDLVITLKLQRPYLNSVVMYKSNGKKTIGRVIGLPGNEIDISENGALLVNGVNPPEDIFYPTFQAENSGIEFPLTVEENEVFILNDYRENSNDSRTFGTVNMGDIDGTALLTIRRRGF